MTVLASTASPIWHVAGSTTATARRPATLPVPGPPIETVGARLAAAAARAVGVEVEHVLSSDRHGRVVLARQLAMVCARRRGYSLLEVARAFARNHTTVLYAERRIAERQRTDPTITELLRSIMATTACVATDRAAPAPARWQPAAPVVSVRVTLVMTSSTSAPAPAPARERQVPPVRPAPAPAPARAAGRSRSRREQDPCVGRGGGLPVGSYSTPSGSRRVVLATRDGQRRLIDRAAADRLGPGGVGSDERVIDTFGWQATLAQIEVVASAYLDEARAARRPVAGAIRT